MNQLKTFNNTFKNKNIHKSFNSTVREPSEIKLKRYVKIIAMGERICKESTSLLPLP